MRRCGWVFHTAVEMNYQPSQIAKAFNGDKDLRAELQLLRDTSAGPFATEHPDTTREKAEAKAAAKKTRKA